MSVQVRRRIVIAMAIAIAVLAVTGVISTAADRRDGPQPSKVVFVPGCCEGAGIGRARLGRLKTALGDGDWREAKWVPLLIWVNGEPSPREGTLAATPERGELAASIRVRVVDGSAKRIDVMGVDSTPERAQHVHAQVQAGEFGEAVPYITDHRCGYSLDPAAMPALLDRLAMGGIPRVPTRLRPDYSPGADWPGLQQLRDRWLVSWRNGEAGEPRLLLSIERTRERALARAESCLARMDQAPSRPRSSAGEPIEQEGGRQAPTEDG